jgi:hypothetical protein
MIINTQNIESLLLLFIDNELSIAERKEVESYIQENPTYANELAILSQTIMPSDSIIFEDKALLYRHEEMEIKLPNAIKQNLYKQEAKIVEGYFTKSKIIKTTASIAAMLLLIIGYRFYQIEHTENKKILIANNNPLISNDQVQPVSPKAQKTLENCNSTKYISEKLIASKGKMFTNKKWVPAKETTFKHNESETISIIASKASVASSNNSITEINNETDIEKNTQQNNQQNFQHTIQTNNESSKPLAITTSNQNEEKEHFEELDTDDHDRSIFIANFEIDGDKLRGFTRRVNAIFKRNKNEKQ